jgi:hypothetical protein
VNSRGRRGRGRGRGRSSSNPNEQSSTPAQSSDSNGQKTQQSSHNSARGGGGGSNAAKNSRGKNRSQNRSRRPQSPAGVDYAAPITLTPKTYGVIFFANFDQAKLQMDQIVAKKSEVDQLNIVIEAEGNMDDPDLVIHGKVFAGAAWTLIHQRRTEDGWYDIKQPVGPIKPHFESETNN